MSVVVGNNSINWCWFYELELLPGGDYKVLDHWREHKTNEVWTKRAQSCKAWIDFEEDCLLHAKTPQGLSVKYRLNCVKAGVWMQSGTHRSLRTAV